MPSNTLALLPAYARKINAAHIACVNAEYDALRHAVRAGKILIAVKAIVGHGKFLPWIQQHFKFSYNTALDYKVVAEWCLANPQRAKDLKSIRQLLEARRQDNANATELRTVKLVFNATDWDTYCRSWRS